VDQHLIGDVGRFNFEFARPTAAKFVQYDRIISCPPIIGLQAKIVLLWAEYKTEQFKTCRDIIVERFGFKVEERER
jgi:hypothetical protein